MCACGGEGTHKANGNTVNHMVVCWHQCRCVTGKTCGRNNTRAQSLHASTTSICILSRACDTDDWNKWTTSVTTLEKDGQAERWCVYFLYGTQHLGNTCSLTQQLNWWIWSHCIFVFPSVTMTTEHVSLCRACALTSKMSATNKLTHMTEEVIHQHTKYTFDHLWIMNHHHQHHHRHH